MNRSGIKNLIDRFRASALSVELLKVSVVYAALSLINLRVKIFFTAPWFTRDGLMKNHSLLTEWAYTNNEQSRIFQWMIPEALHKLTGWPIPNAYMFQRWFFILLAFICFHLYLRKWFKGSAAFAAVCFLAAIMPLSYFPHLQESFSLLLLSFVLLLWLIREKKTWFYCAALLLAAMNNETVLIIPAVFFFYNFESWKPKSLFRVSVLTMLTCAPAYIWTVWIRYYTVIACDAKHLGGGWHLLENLQRIWLSLQLPPFYYWRAVYLYIFFIFGIMWIFTYLKFKDKPLFLCRASLMVPLFIICHLLTGKIDEVRQMLPLAFIIVPMAMFYMFPELKNELPEEINHDSTD
jgi:hypothetical protein